MTCPQCGTSRALIEAHQATFVDCLTRIVTLLAEMGQRDLSEAVNGLRTFYGFGLPAERPRLPAAPTAAAVDSREPSDMTQTEARDAIEKLLQARPGVFVTAAEIRSACPQMSWERYKGGIRELVHQGRVMQIGSGQTHRYATAGARLPPGRYGAR